MSFAPSRMKRLFFASLGLAACGGSAPSAVSASSPSPPPRAEPAPVEPPRPAERGLQALQKEARRQPDMPPAGASVDRVMRAHFHDALLIREAVIAGKPEQAANPATVLALIDNLEDQPPHWRNFVERMQQDARRIKDSTSAAQTAAATADLGVACGLCHQKHGGPKVASEPPPLEANDLPGRMKRHTWASERLWEGLVVPSSDAWNIGTKALSGSPFPPEGLKRGGVVARSAARDFARLVAEAADRKTIEERAALYAELLVTCGTCHRAMREASTE
jgi:cytochrome c556